MLFKHPARYAKKPKNVASAKALKPITKRWLSGYKTRNLEIDFKKPNVRSLTFLKESRTPVNFHLTPTGEWIR